MSRVFGSDAFDEDSVITLNRAHDTRQALAVTTRGRLLREDSKQAAASSATRHVGRPQRQLQELAGKIGWHRLPRAPMRPLPSVLVIVADELEAVIPQPLLPRPSAPVAVVR